MQHNFASKYTNKMYRFKLSFYVAYFLDGYNDIQFEFGL